MRLIVGVTGASGVELSLPLLRLAREAGCETYLVLTDAARATWALECGEPIGTLEALAGRVCDVRDLAAPISSGSFRTDGMAILPCSMKTLAGVVSGYSENLLLRAADVTLKEGRPLVLCPRESPLSRVHLRNLSEAAALGCVVMPPMPVFYQGRLTPEQQAELFAARVLARFGLLTDRLQEWGSAPESE